MMAAVTTVCTDRCALRIGDDRCPFAVICLLKNKRIISNVYTNPRGWGERLSEDIFGGLETHVSGSTAGSKVTIKNAVACKMSPSMHYPYSTR
jgi:hypothetical protein